MNRNQLEAAQALFTALENLRDEQNGPPLIERASHWEEAMKKARLALQDWRIVERQIRRLF